MLISFYETDDNQLAPGQENIGGGSSVVTLLFAKKSWNNNDRCAGALS
jgi:hypothetical protein